MTDSGNQVSTPPLDAAIPQASLESILCTEELHRRKSRPPDYERENRALLKLVSALAASPGTILQTLAETILDLTQSDSAGLSLLTSNGETPDVGGQRFYWPAIAGMWNPHVGGGTPRNFGPCGDVLDQNRTLLFTHFERRYPYLLPVAPTAEECLLVPFYVADKAVGTIWAILHSDRRRFDAEDDRVMASLEKFASSAYQTVVSLDELRFQSGEREKAEADLRKLADGLEMQVRERTRNLAASEARARGLANEQAALRRVATLVAHESSPAELLDAVVVEAARVLDIDGTGMIRFDSDETATIVAQSETQRDVPPVGTSFTLDGENIVTSVHRTGQAVRMDDWESATGSVAAAGHELGVRSTVASPIVVDGRLWGVMVAATDKREPLPADTESRLVGFTELLATAISNAESREALTRLADEQAALRRVAVMVAEGSTPERVFAGVVEQVGNLLDVPAIIMVRFETDTTSETIAVWGDENPFEVGEIFKPWPDMMLQIQETGSPARLDADAGSTGASTARPQDDRVESGVGVPISVEGRVWGAMIALATSGAPLPESVEERLSRFTDLVATAVSNTKMRTELAASRARVIATADETRRRIERDLHDGAQQQLVTLALGLRAAERRVPAGPDDLRSEVGRVADRLMGVVEELREMSRGIHPAVLTEGGLSPAVEALALRSPLQVELDVRCDRRFPERIEVAAYYVVSEALTNCAKHANASCVRVELSVEQGRLHLSIVDDGAGGADPSGGSGLIGLKDRVEALGGTIRVASAPGSGTQLDVEIPLLTDDLSAALTSEPLLRA